MPEALRIGLLTHSVNPRGGVVHTLELARALHGRGHRVTVFAPVETGQQLFREVPHEFDGVPVGPAPADLADLVGQRIGAFREHLRHRLAREHFDVLHTHDGIGGNALADLADEGLIDGFVRTVHHLDPFKDPRLAAWQARSVTRARLVLCVSATWREQLQREWGLAAEQVANGVDLARFGRRPQPHDALLARRLGLDVPGPVFLAVGGIESRKNSLRILEAFVAARAAHPQAVLVVAGGASLLDHSECARAFHALAARAGLAEGRGLRLTGPLDDADLPGLYRRADALLLPSLREGFGLVVLEALACGTPVLVSRIAPFTEYLADEVAAGHVVYADPLDSVSIAQAMHAVIEPARRAALARELPEVCRRFDWSASAQRHEALYRRVAASRAELLH